MSPIRICLLLFGVTAIVAGLLVGAMWQLGVLTPIATPPPHTLVDTKKIDEKTPIGGVANPTSSTNTPTPPSSSHSPSTPSASNIPPQTPSLSNEYTPPLVASPRQQEIKNSITTERTYTALSLSNDPMVASSWAHSAVRVPQAWDQTTGAPVIVAVIDSGFALDHEDLVDAWHKNPGEQGMTQAGEPCWTGTSVDKQTNKCDDDKNGYVDDWRGWSFSSVSNNPQAGLKNPSGGGVAHGTEVAGLVGATANNNKGTAGFNWQTKIMPLQVLDDNGNGYTSSVVAAIEYAANNGAKVINMSLGGYESDSALQPMIDYAYNKGVVIVAAAGNCGTGKEAGCAGLAPGTMSYPAVNPHVIGVGAIDQFNNRASFSSYGPALDIVAPGSGALRSTIWTQSNSTSAYSSTLYGTSFASPIVASYASLLRSQRPTSTVDDITALINASAQKVSKMNGQLYSNEYGHGLIDADAGVRVARSLASKSTQPTLQQTGSNISEHSFIASSPLSSGCTVEASVYCTVWATNDSGYDRYLPYLTSSTSPNVGWSWTGAVLDSGEWRLRARSGDTVSTQPYYLFSK